MRLWADFHEVADDDTVWSDLRYANYFQPEKLISGQTVLVTDGAGTECKAELIEIRDRFALLKVDQSSFRFGEPMESFGLPLPDRIVQMHLGLSEAAHGVHVVAEPA